MIDNSLDSDHESKKREEEDRKVEIRIVNEL
jgi:hypothetical protein